MAKLSDMIKDPRDRAPEPAPLPPLDPAIAANLRALWREFARDLPSGATHAGRYVPTDGDRWCGLALEVPDGTYRIAGAEWVFTFKQNQLVGATRVTPPHYAGRGVRVVEVPNE
jgi:hypothetical protein